MTAEDLALWCHSLFEGKILNQQSMDEMLQFVTFVPSGNMTGYGLGVQLFKKKYSNGKKALGHGGANIGTSAYMVHLPENQLSVVVMINSMNHQCTEYILKKLINISLKELNAFSIIPSFDFFQIGFIIIGATLVLIAQIIIRIRRRLKVKTGR
jgi:CubicO group peptidase (beta-lactamase class C family)